MGKIPWRRERLPTPAFQPEEFYGLYGPWGRKESDITERFSLSLSCHDPQLGSDLHPLSSDTGFLTGALISLLRVKQQTKPWRQHRQRAHPAPRLPASLSPDDATSIHLLTQVRNLGSHGAPSFLSLPPQLHCPLDSRVFLQNLFSNLNSHSNHLGIYSSLNSESARRRGLQAKSLVSVPSLHSNSTCPPWVLPPR